MKKYISISVMALGLGLGVMAAQPAQAAYVSICDNPASEGGCPGIGQPAGSPDPYITFKLNDFEGGFQINGVTVQSGRGNPTTYVVHEGQGPSIVSGAGENDFSGAWLDNGQTKTVNATIFFYEPLNDPTIWVSDVLHYSYTTDGTYGHIDGSVISGYVGELSVSALNAAGIRATGYARENVIQGYHFDNAFITAGFQSGVPEASTWVMMLLGFASLGYAGHRRAKARAAIA